MVSLAQRHSIRAKFGQVDKWNICLRAARMPRIRSYHDETSTPDTCTGFQGQGGAGRHQGREDAGGTGPADDVHPNQITAWKAQVMEGVAGIFGLGNAGCEAAPVVDVKVLHAKIGELTLEVDFLADALGKAGLLNAKR